MRLQLHAQKSIRIPTHDRKFGHLKLQMREETKVRV